MDSSESSGKTESRTYSPSKFTAPRHQISLGVKNEMKGSRLFGGSYFRKAEIVENHMTENVAERQGSIY